MKIALVYDHVNKIGGAERILTALHELYPQAPLYTGMYNPETAPWAKTFTVIPSWMQFLPFAAKQHELYPGLPFLAFQQFDFSQFDVVISITSAEAKAVRTSSGTLHICYCLTPTRYLWSHFADYFRNTLFKWLGLPVVWLLRTIDIRASQRPDAYVAISHVIRNRIGTYYKRDAQVVYPPVDTDKFTVKNQTSHIKNQHNYFLVVSRLVKYKHIELAIEACNSLKLPLKIVGTGHEENRLKKMAGPTVEFVGNLTEQELIEYYQNCHALLYTAEEDFGISMIEALACGKPVIAYGVGGAREIIESGVTGEFFQPQTSTQLVQALRKFATTRYNSTSCRKRALLFSKHTFKKQFSTLVRAQWKEFASHSIIK